VVVSQHLHHNYIEDNNITLNYNPTGNTISTSVGAGWTIQDGNGIIEVISVWILEPWVL
jgi:hypothetical protein